MLLMTIYEKCRRLVDFVNDDILRDPSLNEAGHVTKLLLVLKQILEYNFIIL